jgi:hypothetical protein
MSYTPPKNRALHDKVSAAITAVDIAQECEEKAERLKLEAEQLLYLAALLRGKKIVWKRLSV